MRNQRWRPLILASIAIGAIWVVAMLGYTVAKNARVTAEKVQAYVHSVELSKLFGDARAKALRELARQLNALSLEERRKVRFERTAQARTPAGKLRNAGAGGEKKVDINVSAPSR